MWVTLTTDFSTSSIFHFCCGLPHFLRLVPVHQGVYSDNLSEGLAKNVHVPCGTFSVTQGSLFGLIASGTCLVAHIRWPRLFIRILRGKITFCLLARNLRALCLATECVELAELNLPAAVLPSKQQQRPSDSCHD